MDRLASSIIYQIMKSCAAMDSIRSMDSSPATSNTIVLFLNLMDLFGTRTVHTANTHYGFFISGFQRVDVDKRGR